MQINLLKWCDEKISYLKKYGIIFKNGVAVLPEESIYKDIPLMVSTYKYRNDIPEGMLFDEIQGFNPIIIEGDLNKVV